MGCRILDMGVYCTMVVAILIACCCVFVEIRSSCKRIKKMRVRR